jgi:hypothetical protein
MSSTTPKRRRGRTIATVVVCIALAGAAAVAIAMRKPQSTSTVKTPSIFKTAAVSRGDLTTTERIDGTVQLSSTLAVLHRIEGQTSSSTTPSASTSASASATTPRANGSASAGALSSGLLVNDCSNPTPTSTTVPSTTVAPTTVPSTTVAPTTVPSTTTPDTSPVETTPTATSTTTSTTVAITEPATVAPTTPPGPTCDTTTTTSAPATVDTAPVPAGGPGGRTGGARTGTSSSSSPGGGASTTSNARVTQTITSIVAANTSIVQGEVLYTVDGAPVVALDGALPAWRSMSISSVDGADIAQLEASLVAMGYDPSLKVVVDNHFDSATRTMVKAWQKGLGLATTGTVTLGSVVFLPSSTTVSAVGRAVGDSVGDGDTILTLATPSQEVLVDVPAGDEAQVVPGLAVGVGSVQGTVSRLRSADRNGAVVVQALIAPATAIASATNGSAVKVTLTLQNNAGVLIAPAGALVSRLDGTYAVQVQTSDGATKWLTVEMLGVSGGNVAIRGNDLADGTVLLLPA